MLSLGLDYLYMVLYPGLITKLINPTQKEQGSINYDLHVDNSNDAMFMFHETWGSEEDLNAHSQSSHIKKCFEIMGGMLVSTEV
jgi:quinol monooxygenase YgiN